MVFFFGVKYSWLDFYQKTKLTNISISAMIISLAYDKYEKESIKLKMPERISPTHYDPKYETRNETFADGSVNVIADRVGDAIDLNNTGHERLNLGPSSVLNITIENFDEETQKLVRTDYVMTEGGYGPGVILTSASGERGIRTQWVPEYNPAWIESLQSHPLTIGSRPDRFDGAKLKSVSAAMSGGFANDSPNKTTANPISIAMRVMDEQNNGSN
jgi:hypothetical protein